MEILFYYLAVINVTGFVLMAVDKLLAKTGKRRISEKALLITAIIGGSAGVILAMYIFRHKTNHTLFRIVIPLIFMAEVIAIILIQRSL